MIKNNIEAVQSRDLNAALGPPTGKMEDEEDSYYKKHKGKGLDTYTICSDIMAKFPCGCISKTFKHSPLIEFIHIE